MKLITQQDKIKQWDYLFDAFVNGATPEDMWLASESLFKSLKDKHAQWKQSYTKNEQEIIELLKSGKEVCYGSDDSGSYWYYRTGDKYANGGAKIAHVSRNAVYSLQRKGVIKLTGSPWLKAQLINHTI